MKTGVSAQIGLNTRTPYPTERRPGDFGWHGSSPRQNALNDQKGHKFGHSTWIENRRRAQPSSCKTLTGRSWKGDGAYNYTVITRLATRRRNFGWFLERRRPSLLSFVALLPGGKSGCIRMGFAAWTECSSCLVFRRARLWDRAKATSQGATAVYSGPKHPWGPRLHRAADGNNRSVLDAKKAAIRALSKQMNGKRHEGSSVHH